MADSLAMTEPMTASDQLKSPSTPTLTSQTTTCSTNGSGVPTLHTVASTGTSDSDDEIAVARRLAEAAVPRFETQKPRHRISSSPPPTTPSPTVSVSPSESPTHRNGYSKSTDSSIATNTVAPLRSVLKGSKKRRAVAIVEDTSTADITVVTSSAATVMGNTESSLEIDTVVTGSDDGNSCAGNYDTTQSDAGDLQVGYDADWAKASQERYETRVASESGEIHGVKWQLDADHEVSSPGEEPVRTFRSVRSCNDLLASPGLAARESVTDFGSSSIPHIPPTSNTSVPSDVNVIARNSKGFLSFDSLKRLERLFDPVRTLYADSHVPFEMSSYLATEMLGLGEGITGKRNPAAGDHLLNFFAVPWALERLIWFGCIICFDGFLYVFTFLPLRVVVSILLLVTTVKDKILSWVLTGNLPNLTTPPSDSTDTSSSATDSDNCSNSEHKGWSWSFHRTQLFDLMRGLMVVVALLALQQLHMSQVYHFIRGQNILKLYVLTSMLEVMDKLVSSFGQDALDTLHQLTAASPLSPTLVLSFLIATAYVTLHSVLYFGQIATYTVVLHSADSALISVLILNNFAELKSFVFKKFDSNNLFQLACSDVLERFHMAIFLSAIVVVAVAQAAVVAPMDTLSLESETLKDEESIFLSTFGCLSIPWSELIQSYSRPIVAMLGAESVADSVKHAFIHKFNGLTADIYGEFGYILRADIVKHPRQRATDGLVTDATYAVTRRLGLSTLPLAAVVIRYLHLAWHAPGIVEWVQNWPREKFVWYGLGIWSVLVLMKILLGVSLIMGSKWAAAREVETLDSTTAGVISSRTPLVKASEQSRIDKDIKDTLELREGLADIGRYTVYKGRIL